MCYAKPGPRCSTHARQSLDKANAALAAAAQHTLDVGDQCRRDGVNMSGYHKPEHPVGAAMAAERDARQAAHEAQQAFDATPAGITALKDQIAALEEQHGAGVLTRNDYTEAQQRLTRGQATRRDQKEAYAQVHQAAPWAGSRPAGDSAEDEAAADAPVPACSCITYRYQNDCEHLTARIEQARKDLLPTSSEASLRLHSANSRLRTIEADKAKWTTWLNEQVNEHGWQGGAWSIEAQAAEVSPEFDAWTKQWRDAKYEAADAEKAFHRTPAGQAYLRQRADAVRDRMGWDTGSTHQDRERANTGADERAADAARYTEITGQPAPVEETNPQPPQLMYGPTGCADNCHDFAWTGKCAHTDTDMAFTASLQDAFKGSREGKAMAGAIDKAFGTKKPNRLARMLGRG